MATSNKQRNPCHSEETDSRANRVRSPKRTGKLLTPQTGTKHWEQTRTQTASAREKLVCFGLIFCLLSMFETSLLKRSKCTIQGCWPRWLRYGRYQVRVEPPLTSVEGRSDPHVSWIFFVNCLRVSGDEDRHRGLQG